MQIQRVKQQTVVGQVMNQIKELIASGQIKPHDRMPTETELAKMFGTGRSSIREAIKIFQHLGILETHTRSGTFVCPSSNISTEALTWSILLGKDDIFELLDLRRIIEVETLQQLTHSFDPSSTVSKMMFFPHKELRDTDSLLAAQSWLLSAGQNRTVFGTATPAA